MRTEGTYLASTSYLPPLPLHPEGSEGTEEGR